MSPDGRRTTRTIAQVITGLILLGLVIFMVIDLAGNADWLGWIALACLGILGLREVFTGSENVAARLDVKIGPRGGEVEFDNRPADGAANQEDQP